MRYCRVFEKKWSIYQYSEFGSRGWQEDSQISAVEKRIIGEYDASVFILGNFEDCIKQKTKLFEDSSVPVIVTGGPESCDLECQYVGKIGRRVTRMRKVEDQKSLI
jgi:Uncharacterized protein related to methyl coenzyme M reductase subunit C